MKKIISILITFFFMISIFSYVPKVESTNNIIDTIQQSYIFEEPNFDIVNIYNENYTRVTIDNCELYGHANKPRLPVKPLKFLLPQSSTIDNILIETSNIIIEEESSFSYPA